MKKILLRAAGGLVAIVAAFYLVVLITGWL